MSSKRRLRRVCQAKRAYPSKAVALASLFHHPPEDRDGLHAYCCPLCHRWHLGHLPGRVKTIIGRRQARGAVGLKAQRG